MQRKSSLFRSVAVLTLLALSAPARNIDLSTVPPRAGVELTIYNGEDITLVRENRTLTVKRGLNKLQFSWADTLIDPTSVELTFPGQEDKVTILETVFPHDKPQQLSWTVQSDLEGDAQAEISYFTAGIRWKADYVITLTEDGKTIPNSWLTTPAEPPRSFAYCSDTCYLPELRSCLEGVDLLFHEATFLHQDLARAKETYHTTALQAATLARDSQVRQLCIGHFSARYEDESQLLEEAQSVFSHTILAKENLTIKI